MPKRLVLDMSLKYNELEKFGFNDAFNDIDPNSPFDSKYITSIDYTDAEPEDEEDYTNDAIYDFTLYFKTESDMVIWKLTYL
jgi:hypothetical protein